MNGDPKYRKMKKTAKAQGRATKKAAKQTGKTIKRGAKAIVSGTRQGNRAIKKASTQKGTPKRGTRVALSDAKVKARSGAAAMTNPTPKRKIKKKAYTTYSNMEYGNTPGAKKYLTKKGKPTNRRGGRPKKKK